jgi:hypothetical protein
VRDSTPTADGWDLDASGRPRKQPAGVKGGNWIPTMPGKGWFVILRLYSPLEPFFDDSWRPSEIELVP